MKIYAIVTFFFFIFIAGLKTSILFVSIVPKCWPMQLAIFMPGPIQPKLFGLAIQPACRLKMLQKINHRTHTGDFGDWILFWAVGDEVINQNLFKAVKPRPMLLEFPNEK